MNRRRSERGNLGRSGSLAVLPRERPGGPLPEVKPTKSGAMRAMPFEGRVSGLERSPQISRIATQDANQDLNRLRQPNVLPFSAHGRCYLGYLG